MEQITFEARRNREQAISLALYHLWNEEQGRPAQLAEYFPKWSGPEDVPYSALDKVQKILEKEVAFRRKYGDEIYNRTKSVEAKLNIYHLVLTEMSGMLEINEYQPNDSISWVQLQAEVRAALGRHLEREGGNAISNEPTERPADYGQP